MNLSRRCGYTLLSRLSSLLLTMLLASSLAFAQELTPLRLVTNWFAQSEHGGFYAALQDGLYEDAGLDVTIMQGGPQVAGMALLASGQVDMIMTGAAEVLFARNEGIPIVAFFATFQQIPQGLMFHESQAISDFDELAGRTVAISPGAAYWDFISNKYDLEGRVQVINYSGQSADWLRDESRITQIYVTSEPFVVSQQGASPAYLNIGESGFNPYSNLIATTEAFIAENPEIVAAFAAASSQGWQRFLDNPLAYLDTLAAENDAMTEEFVAWTNQTQRPLIATAETDEHGLGFMSLERWETLLEQLGDLGLVDAAGLDASAAFTAEFIVVP